MLEDITVALVPTQPNCCLGRGLSDRPICIARIFLGVHSPFPSKVDDLLVIVVNIQVDLLSLPFPPSISDLLTETAPCKSIYLLTHNMQDVLSGKSPVWVRGVCCVPE